MDEIKEIQRRAGIVTEGRTLKVSSEFVYDVLMQVNSARNECPRDPEELQARLSRISSALNEILQGRGRR